MAVAGSNYMHVMHDLVGRPAIEYPMRFLDTPGIEAASDGLVGFNTNAGEMFRMFMLLVERPDLMDDPSYANIAHRLALGPEWQRIIDDWLNKHTVAEAIEGAVALRIPVAPVHDGESVLRDEHLVDRGVFVEGTDGLVRPRPPYRLDGQTLGVDAPAPRVGEHDGAKLARASRAPRIALGGAPKLPLAGIKVLDL